MPTTRRTFITTVLGAAVTGWATAPAVGAPWPVLALWWDADRAGYTLASGFRRPVGYVWLANGTPAGEGEAMRTFAARLVGGSGAPGGPIRRRQAYGGA